MIPLDEALHALRCKFQYEFCYQHCEYSGTEKCNGVDFCIAREGYKAWSI